MAVGKEVHRWMHWSVIPVMYIQTELLIAGERGLDPRDLIREIGLDLAILTDYDYRSVVPPLIAHAWLMHLILHRTGNHGLGFEIGLRLPPTAHGILGSTMLSSRNLREALRLSERFWHLYESAAQMHLSEQDGWMVVNLHLDAVLSRKLRPVFFDGLISVMCHGAGLLSGDIHPHTEIWVDYPEPDYYAQFRDRLPLIRYGMPSIQMRLSPDVLDRPLKMSNSMVLNYALDGCERESQLRGYSSEDFLSLVRQHMVLGKSNYPTSEMLAERLHVSLRTLRRRLQIHGTGYKQLLETARRQDAMRLLDNPALGIHRIAELLGYSNPINFTRAFRQWTGKTPTEYRTLSKATLRVV